MTRHVLIVLLASVVAAGEARVGQPPVTGEVLRPDTIKQIDEVFAKWDTTSSPGCALGISRSGEVVYTRGYGMSNFEYDVAITPASIFHVASISKQFTAMAIALLARDGELSRWA